MTAKGGVAVVFWGPHSPSSESFARHLHAPCYLIHYLAWKRPWVAPFKYPLMWVKTWQVLLKQRPSAILVINTPVFAPMCVYLYAVLMKIPFVMNIHGHTLGGRRWGWSVPIQRFLAQRAALNLVGTSEYQRILESWDARYLFLEDPPIGPEIKVGGPTNEPGEFCVTVVSTFAGDEPLEAVLDAARMLPDVCFFITGDTHLARKGLLNSAPGNVSFVGYLKGEAYWKLLSSSHAVMTLTTNPYSLVSGGYEGMYLGKALLLSRQPALIEYFTRGAVFIDHTPESIVAGVLETKSRREELERESSELLREKSSIWQQNFQVLKSTLGVSFES
jgi:glycosyltransferase involved in cell wall biosynthesis